MQAAEPLPPQVVQRLMKEMKDLTDKPAEGIQASGQLRAATARQARGRQRRCAARRHRCT